MPRTPRSSWIQRAVQIGLWVGATSSVGAAFAQSTEDTLTSKFAIDDRDPASSIPSAQQAMKRPLDMGYHLMLLTEKAEAATKRGDHIAAAKYWLAIGKAVPDRAVSFSNACQAYEAAGDYKAALENCWAALGKGGVTVEDNLRFVRLVLETKPGALDASSIADVEAVGRHLEHELDKKEGPLMAELVRCQLGARLEDVPRLQACTKKLDALAPDDPRTLVFSWSLALRQRNLTQAERILERAKQAKLPAAATQKMSDALQLVRERQAPWWQRALHDSRALGITAGLMALAAGVAGFIGRRRRSPRTA